MFWFGPKRFGRVQIILVKFKLDFSGLIFIIWTCPKLFEPDQNELDPSKTIGTRPKLFGWSKIILDHQNHFGQVQIIKISPEKSNFNLIKMI